MSELGDQLDAKKQELEAVKTKLDGILMAVPNIPDTSVPEGATEEDNVLVRTWSAPGEFSFTPKDHVDLTNESGLINFEQASKIAGSRFVVMRGYCQDAQSADPVHVRYAHSKTWVRRSIRTLHC